MSHWDVLLLVTVAAPWIGAIVTFAAGEARARTRTAVGLVAASAATLGAIGTGVGVASGADAGHVEVPLLGIGFGLHADGLGVLFAVVAASLWLLTTVYATGYMSHANDRARFFGFFAICVGSAIGIAFAANLLTLFVFYEALTLATYPLVVHSGTQAALKGGRTYLLYALSGGTLLAVGVIWLSVLGGGADFGSGAGLSETLLAGHAPELTVIFVLLVAGFGVKAALFPAHGWLPAAMVAPAPVSALLHAVAVVKAGVFGLARVILDVYGIETARSLGVLAPLAALAAFTLLFASVRALAQDDIKKRLAYSTIGQLSYIVLGLALGTPVAAAAALAHLAHHAVLKITMFFTAGVLAEELKVYRVSRMDGVGRRMPVTMTAFSVAALGIIGVPPIAGFVSKWGLGVGGLGGGEVWPILVLSVSSLLNAAYLLPMIGRAWFKAPHAEWGARAVAAPGQGEADRLMVWPLAITSTAGVLFGVAAAAPWAPASWAAEITGAAREFVIPWPASLPALDQTGGLFLALAVVVWGASALSAWVGVASARRRFSVFFVLAASGSVGLAFASDPALFYASFSVMALSAYGLIAHEGTPKAISAARAYLAFTLVSEALLLAGLMIGSTGVGSFSSVLLASPWMPIGFTALLLAFGIKIGAVGLGGWMPATYAALPAGVGSAVAGVVSSAGMLGLLRFVPGGIDGLEGWGATVMAVGLVSALFGAVAGCLQRESRHVLAYSSMSQFGLMTVGIGAGIAATSAWPAAVAAVSIYLVHHGFAKAALFAADDVAVAQGRSRALLVATVLPALALAGAPLTSGAAAKIGLKGVASEAPAGWAHALELLLPIAAVGTALLMARFLVLSLSQGLRSQEGREHRVVPYARWATLGILILAVLVPVWVVGLDEVRHAAAKSLTPHYLWVLSWPVLLGVALAGLVWVGRAGLPRRLTGLVPPGDLWAPVLRRADRAWESYSARLAGESGSAVAAPGPVTPARVRAIVDSVEASALSWPVAASLMVLLALLALVLAR